MEEYWVTVDQLRALAAGKGFHPTEIAARKIERWRKERLLPRPRLIRLERGQGTHSEYPPETEQQLLALWRVASYHDPEHLLDRGARLGGYLARRHDGPPGWRAIRKGWLSLQRLASGRSPCFFNSVCTSG